MVNYEKGALCSYGINGKLLRHIAHNDNVQVIIVKYRHPGAAMEQNIKAAEIDPIFLVDAQLM